MLFEFPIPIAPPFYELDFSEVVVLIGGFALGPGAAVCIEGLKILLNLLLNGTITMGIGCLLYTSRCIRDSNKAGKNHK